MGASEEMKNDKDLLTAAYQNMKGVTLSAQSRTGTSQQVVLAALGCSGKGTSSKDILLSAPLENRTNETMVLAALDATPSHSKEFIWDVLPAELQRNERVRKAAGK